MSIIGIIRTLHTFSAAAFLALCIAASANAARGPATPEEIARVVQIAAAADKDPLGTMTSADGRWLEKWTEDVPDYNFGPDKGAYWAVIGGAAKGDLKRVVRFQHTVSTAAWQVQHQIHDPQKNEADMEAKTLAGVEGLLRAYEVLAAQRPENRSPQMDEALAQRNAGTLPAFVKALPPMPQR